MASDKYRPQDAEPGEDHDDGNGFDHRATFGRAASASRTTTRAEGRATRSPKRTVFLMILSHPTVSSPVRSDRRVGTKTS